MIGETGQFSFNFKADSNTSYDIIANGDLIANDFCFVQGDSLIFEQDSSSLVPIADCHGAYLFRYQTVHQLNDSTFSEMLSDLNDSSCLSYSRFKLNLQMKAKEYALRARLFKKQFPEYKYFVREDSYFARDFHQTWMVRYIWNRERVLKQDCPSDGSSWIDTITISDYDDVNPFLLSDILTKVMEVRADQWYLSGIDTEGSDHDHFDEQFRIALRWTGMLRAFALCEIVRKSDLNGPLKFSIQIAQRSLDTLRKMHIDPRIITIIEIKLRGMRAREEGAIVENFVLPDSNHHLHSLIEYRGKAILLHFWGTWCQPCRSELPALDSFELSHKSDTGIVFLSVALESNAYEKWKEFLETHRTNDVELYSDVLYPADPSRVYGYQFVQWVPAYIVIDRHGRLVSADEYPPPNKQLDVDILKAERD